MIIATNPTKEHEKLFLISWPTITLISNYIADGLNPNLFRSLNIEICDLFEIWCLRFGIFSTLVPFSIKLAALQARGCAEH